MVRTFEAQRAEVEKRGGTFRVVRFWMRAEWDLIRIALRLDVRPLPQKRGTSMWNGIGRDLRFAIRGFARHPVTTITVVLTLALGIGANTGAFSLLYNVLYQPLPYANPDEIVFLAHEVENATIDRLGMSGPDLVDYQTETASFAAIAGIASVSTTVTTENGPLRIEIGMVTPEFFDVLGTDAELGRTLTREDWAPVDLAVITDPNFEAPPSPLVLSARFWRERLGSDPRAIGSSVEMNGSTHTVVGVMPEGFRVYFPDGWYVPDDHEAWALVPAEPTTMARPATNLTILGRLSAGVTVEAAQVDVGRVSASLRERFPEHAERSSQARVTRLHDEVVGGVRTVTWVLFAAVGLVLLIACVNVGNLLLVRGISRQGEFRTRTILGAGPIRIGRQLLVESVLLFGTGTVLGLALSSVALRLLSSVEPGYLPRVGEIDLDLTVLVFTGCVGLVAAVVFGLVPLFGALREGGRLEEGRTHTGSARAHRTRSLLTSLELALSVLLVAGATLLFRSVAHLQSVDVGFQPERVMTARLSLPFFEFRDPADRVRLFDRLLTELQATEWVDASALGNQGQIPLDGELRGSIGRYEIEEARTLDPTGSRVASHIFVSEGYFDAIGARLLEGRAYEPGELRDEQPPRVVIDRTFAETLAPNGSALGSTIFIPSFAGGGAAPWIAAEVVGVVETVRFGSLLVPDERPTVFRSVLALTPLEAAVFVRTDRSAGEIEQWMRSTLSALAPSVPVHDVAPFSDIVDEAMATQRFSLAVFGVFAGIALLLGGIGLYGVLSTAVGHRTREIGLRMALGAQRIDVIRQIATEGARILSVGLAVGLGATMLLSGALRTLLYGVEPTDPFALLLAPVFLLAVGIASCVIPARRAVRMNPSNALRSD